MQNLDHFGTIAAVDIVEKSDAASAVTGEASLCARTLAVDPDADGAEFRTFGQSLKSLQCIELHVAGRLAC